MPNQINHIPVPESMKGQLEENGTLEIEYSLVNEEGVDYIKVNSVEGQSVEAQEEETPMGKMKRKMGYTEESEDLTMG